MCSIRVVFVAFAVDEAVVVAVEQPFLEVNTCGRHMKNCEQTCDLGVALCWAVGNHDRCRFGNVGVRGERFRPAVMFSVMEHRRCSNEPLLENATFVMFVECSKSHCDRFVCSSLRFRCMHRMRNWYLLNSPSRRSSGSTDPETKNTKKIQNV